MYLGMQLLRPGEWAPSHRQTPNAVHISDGEKPPGQQALVRVHRGRIPPCIAASASTRSDHFRNQPGISVTISRKPRAETSVRFVFLRDRTDQLAALLRLESPRLAKLAGRSCCCAPQLTHFPAAAQRHRGQDLFIRRIVAGYARPQLMPPRSRAGSRARARRHGGLPHLHASTSRPRQLHRTAWATRAASSIVQTAGPRAATRRRATPNA
ncbi:hypothetical protein SAMN05421548_112164 [Paraburkholderia lycopersici]|uniref:Uncharacterized protein n=1 Tax=Paraburkholderia lycopersici TaxID=416944 RepID=A0A1G6R026_9BURK|nr:hypothetical protein SAMN05421548_112164 [Paraburkholderia lycopersici]